MSKRIKDQIRDDFMQTERNIRIGIRERRFSVVDIRQAFQCYSELFSRYKQAADNYADRMRIWSEVDPLVKVDLERADIVESYNEIQGIVTEYLQYLHKEEITCKLNLYQTDSQLEAQYRLPTPGGGRPDSRAGPKPPILTAAERIESHVAQRQLPSIQKRDLRMEIDQVVSDLERTYLEAKSRQAEIYSKLSLAAHPAQLNQHKELQREQVRHSVGTSELMDNTQVKEALGARPQHRSTPHDRYTEGEIRERDTSAHYRTRDYVSEDDMSECSERSISSTRSVIQIPFAEEYRPQDSDIGQRRGGERRQEQLETQRRAMIHPPGELNPHGPDRGIRAEQPPYYPERLHAAQGRQGMTQSLLGRGRPPGATQFAATGASLDNHRRFRGDAEERSPGDRRTDTGREDPTLPYYGGERNLERLSVPTFTGDSKKFATFWGGFERMVDSKPEIPADLKLVRLDKALSGDAAEVMDNLGCSASSYAIAKRRLFRRYGGERRQIDLRLAELRRLKPVREDNHRDMEKLAEMLEAMVDIMTTGGNVSDLNSSTLYGLIKEKLSAAAIVRYNRWINEHALEKNVETLQIYISEESTYLRDAVETQRPTGATTTTPTRGRDRRPPKESGRSLHVQEVPKPAPTAESPNKAQKCRLCAGSHWIYACEQFKQMSVMDRWARVSRLYLCFKCLGSGHRVADCKWGKPCGVKACGQRHHRMLHREETADAENPAKPKVKAAPTKEKPKEAKSGRVTTAAATADASEEASLVVQTPRGQSVALRTVPVILSANGKRLPVIALLDDGSTRTYVNQRVADYLGISGPVQDACVGMLAGTKREFQGQLVVMQLAATDGSDLGWLKALTMEKVLGSITITDWQRVGPHWPHLEDIQFPKVNTARRVDLLIGTDASTLHNSVIDITGEPGAPVARLTPLGWTCVGSVEPGVRRGNQRQVDQSLHVHTILQADADGVVADTIARYWTMEEPPPATALTAEQRQAQDMVKESCVRVDGHFSVGVPWRKTDVVLPNNYNAALRRLEQTEKRLSRDPATEELYCATFTGHLQKGYIRKVNADPRKEIGQWLVPHFGVVKMDRASTKCRVVFDAPARYKGVSLSDLVLPTPNLLNNLLQVLLRFRRYPICLGGDISEMYLQIRLRPEDRKRHRFLWRDMRTEDEPDLYEYLSLMFGNPASPYMAEFPVVQNAKEHEKTHPRAAQSVRDSTYMDDTLDSVSTVAEGVALYRDLCHVWSAAGMTARKWMSNSKEVLAVIPKEDRAKGIELRGEELPLAKTLGVSWEAERDAFTFKVTRLPPPDQWTKRLLLRRIATLFDPMGLVAPVVVAARILLQHVWQTGAEWDEVIEPRLQLIATKWVEDLPAIEKMSVPRPLQIQPAVVSTQLHLFSDASSEAYGAVCYLRQTYKDGTVSVRLCIARSKVAPLKPVSIPRLELTAALLAVKMMERIMPILELSKLQCWLWTDSTDVLYWVHGRGRCYKPYISNRVGLIQVATDSRRWRHVPTKENPADHASRGLTGAELTANKLWLHGPQYLQKEQAEWPVNKVGTEPEDPERRAGETAATSAVVKPRLRTAANLTGLRLAPDRYSSWLRLCRCTATVFRFIQNASVAPDMRHSGELDAREIQDGETVQIVAAQTLAFPAERRLIVMDKSVPGSSKLLGLRPWIDAQGIMRVDGRLKQAARLSWDTKNPIILPRVSDVTRLVIKQYHEQVLHGGTNQTLSALSRRFWVISAREAIIAWSRRCAQCRVRKARPAVQLMAPLPEIRSRMTLRPFETMSVDYAGPFLTKQGRGRVQQKRYMCLFACLSTRAVHLEMSFSMDTDAFLNALARMVARRGLPREVWSDNGTNFTSGNRELQQLVQALDKARVGTSAANRGITWHFNPPGAPHFNGVHEILVKAAKRALSAVLGSASITDEELMTALAGAEDLMNSRPLTYQSADVKDPIPLTPNHFLHGQCGGYFAPDTVDEDDFDVRKRWRMIQELMAQFWSRWMREWLPSLHPRTKWARMHRNIEVGDLVLLISPDTQRGKWPLGRIEGTFPGPDGVVRTVDVRVHGHLYRRPVVKVCPLELDTIK